MILLAVVCTRVLMSAIPMTIEVVAPLLATSGVGEKWNFPEIMHHASSPIHRWHALVINGCSAHGAITLLHTAISF